MLLRLGKKNRKADYRYRLTPTTEIFQNNPEKIPENPEKSKIMVSEPRFTPSVGNHLGLCSGSYQQYNQVQNN